MADPTCDVCLQPIPAGTRIRHAPGAELVHEGDCAARLSEVMQALEAAGFARVVARPVDWVRGRLTVALRALLLMPTATWQAILKEGA